MGCAGITVQASYKEIDNSRKLRSPSRGPKLLIAFTSKKWAQSNCGPGRWSARADLPKLLFPMRCNASALGCGSRVGLTAGWSYQFISQNLSCLEIGKGFILTLHRQTVVKCAYNRGRQPSRDQICEVGEDAIELTAPAPCINGSICDIDRSWASKGRAP